MNNIAESLKQSLKELYFEIHGIYEPGSEHIFNDCYCAAVDLFRPGMTFRIYFTLGKDNQIKVEHAERWYFG